MGMLVEIFDGQLLHVSKQVLAQTKEGALPHVDHQSVVQIRAHNAHCQDAAQFQQRLSQRGIVGRTRLHHGGDIVVNQRAGEECGGQGRDRGHHYAGQHHQQRELVVTHHIAEHASHRLPAVFRHLGAKPVMSSAWTTSYVDLSCHVRDCFEELG